VTLVPEAASILWGGGWPRRKTLAGVQHQQRAIYYVQREAEGLLANENPDRLLICDRGSLDGLAYWPGPGSGETFLSSVGSRLESEIQRYHCVIHLDTAPKSAYDSTNPLRNETWEEAWELNQRIKAAWSSHPRVVVIPGHASAFIEKLGQALFVVEQVLEGRDFRDIRASLYEE
jgi:hypothetical protein